MTTIDAHPTRDDTNINDKLDRQITAIKSKDGELFHQNTSSKDSEFQNLNFMRS
jgi:hypothetical protein